MIIIAQTGMEGISYGWLFAKTIVIMIVIIVLAFLSIKYVLPMFVKFRRKTDSQIQVLDFQPLEPRKNLYLVKIEDKKVAVAVSEHSICKLCEWEDLDSG